MTVATAFALGAVLMFSVAAAYFLLRARVDRHLAQLDPAAEIRRELESVMVEMNRTTDRNVALLEDRIAQLTQLMAEADRKIALLRRESEKHDAGRALYARLARAAEGRLGSLGSGSEESLEAKVLRLEREGFSPAVIANRVGSTVGEVELIISLARRRR